MREQLTVSVAIIAVIFAVLCVIFTGDITTSAVTAEEIQNGKTMPAIGFLQSGTATVDIPKYTDVDICIEFSPPFSDTPVVTTSLEVMNSWWDFFPPSEEDVPVTFINSVSQTDAHVIICNYSDDANRFKLHWIAMLPTTR